MCCLFWRQIDFVKAGKDDAGNCDDVKDEEGLFKANSHNHLLATQERVADELASTQGNGAVVVRHVGLSLVSGEDG